MKLTHEEAELLDLKELADFADDEDYRYQSARYHNRYRAGDKTALCDFICTCFANDYPIPRWAREEFSTAYKKVAGYQVKSWDDVLGRRLKKGKQLAAQRRRQQLGPKVWDRVMCRHHDGELRNFFLTPSVKSLE